mmetsp:Transcript_3602/g.6401  ORF Transcript_3602/g.6401 Transcript_3602/m.6401 type:complete len:149 (-) Transcript_3602:73-519(-)
MPFCSSSCGAAAAGVWAHPGCGLQLGSLSCLCVCVPHANLPNSKTILVADERGQLVVHPRSGLTPLCDDSGEISVSDEAAATQAPDPPEEPGHERGLGGDQNRPDPEMELLAKFLPASWADPAPEFDDELLPSREQEHSGVQYRNITG